MQLYVPVTVDSVPDTSEYAKQMCLRLARSHPDLVVGTMAKQARPGRVYIDWSQNHQAKTTIAAYSLRARQEPTVSTPLTWAEVHACQRADELVFTASDVRKRLDTHGDLLADLDAEHHPLP
jgi:bifunctional non-homologous end joining protein LigD